MTDDIITREESIMLSACEKVIAKGRREFFRTGMALMAIRDKKLYRAFDATFEEYCQRRWNFGREYGYRLLTAASVQQNVLPTGQRLTSERHARALAQLPADVQGAALKIATLSWEEATGSPAEEMTSSWVKAAAEVTREIITSGGYVSDEDGGMMAATASIAREEMERIKRSWQHMNDRTPPLLRGSFLDVNAAADAIMELQADGPIKVVVYKGKTNED